MAKRKSGLALVLAKVRKKFETRLQDDDFKPNVAEYLKLLQLEKEMEEKCEEHEPKEIRVAWVEPTGTSSSDR